MSKWTNNLEGLVDEDIPKRPDLIALGKPTWAIEIDGGIDGRELSVEGKRNVPQEAVAYVIGYKISKDVMGTPSEVYPIQFYGQK